MLTVDSPVLGRRDRSIKAGWRFPESFRIRSAGLDPAALASLLDPSVTWNDLEWLAATAGLPLVLKGIMTGEDAELAAEYGAVAVVVSNHGGRQLDAAPSTLSVLPEVVAAADDGLEVLIDGGIRHGSDVLAALCARRPGRPRRAAADVGARRRRRGGRRPGSAAPRRRARWRCPMSLRARLEHGDRLVGVFLQSPSPITAEVVSGFELDFVCVEAEHSPLGRESVYALLGAASGPALVRVADNATVPIVSASTTARRA